MFKTNHLIEIGLYNEKFLLHEEKELRQDLKKNIQSAECHFLYIDIENIHPI